MPSRRKVVFAMYSLIVLFCAPRCFSQRDTKELPIGREDARLEIPAIKRLLKAPAINEVPIQLHTPSKLRGIFCAQFVHDREADDKVRGSEQELTVFHREDGSTFLKLYPLRLGTIEFHLIAAFEDGDVAQQTISVNVEPAALTPAALKILEGGWSEPLWIYFDLSDRQQRSPTYLFAQAFYNGFEKPIEVDPKFVSFKVKTNSDRPVIDLDETTGRITPLGIGDALIEARFSGFVRNTCVQVRNHPRGGDISNCKSLRRLERITATNPLNASWTTDPGESVSLFNENNFYTHRLTVTAPNAPVGLLQPIQIPIGISEGKLSRIQFRQWQFNGYGIGSPVIESPSGQNWGSGAAKIVRDEGKKKIVEIVPLQLGEVEVAIAACFADGGFAERFFILRVVPSARGLKEIAGFIYGAYPGIRQSPQIVLALTYAGVKQQIHIDDLLGIKMHVEQPRESPNIQLDAHGQYKELRPGKVVVVFDFEGFIYRLPITVPLRRAAPIGRSSTRSGPT